MNPKIILMLTAAGIDGGVPAVGAIALVFDAEGNVMDNPWGPEVGAYTTGTSVTALGTRDGIRAAIETDVKVAYNLTGDVDVVWL